ncbi:PilZ domain-containing protein [Luteimonas pelagia]
MINEFRRSRRRKVANTILVVDAMTDSVVGRLGNLSETGMLLMANAALAEDALFQFRFTLPGDEAGETPVELGAHLLWQETAGVSGQAWSGFRFITVPEDDMVRLRAWIDAPGGQFE